MPGAGQIFPITRKKGQRQKWQRDNSETDRRCETVKGKEETGYGRCHRGNKKPFRPAIEAISGEHSKQNDEAGKDRDQADQRVNDRADVQYHFVTPSDSAAPSWPAKNRSMT